MEQLIDTEFEVYDIGAFLGHELLGKVYKSRMSKGCLDLYSSFVKENRSTLPDMRTYLAGVANEQLGLMDKQLPPSKRKLPQDHISSFESDFDVHLRQFLGEIPWSLSSMWVNFMSPGDFQPIHKHSGHLSFVWYIDVPQEIYEHNHDYERLNDPEGNSPYGEIHFVMPAQDNPWGVLRESFKPETGDLLIFDSRYMHTVYPFQAEVERVSISGNVEIHDRMIVE